MNASIVKDNKLSTCEHCTLIKACVKEYQCKKFIEAHIVPELQSEVSVTLHYLVQDFPVKTASVASSFVYQPSARRCLGQVDDTNHAMGWLFEDAITILEHRNMSMSKSYILQADIQIQIEKDDQGTQDYVLRDYLSDTVKRVRRCNDVPEYGMDDIEVPTVFRTPIRPS